MAVGEFLISFSCFPLFAMLNRCHLSGKSRSTNLSMKSDILSIWLLIFGSRAKIFFSCKVNWVMNADSDSEPNWLLVVPFDWSVELWKLQTQPAKVDVWPRKRMNQLDRQLARFTILRWLMNSPLRKKKRRINSRQQFVVFMRKTIVWTQNQPTRLRMIKHGVCWCTDAFPSCFLFVKHTRSLTAHFGGLSYDEFE